MGRELSAADLGLGLAPTLIPPSSVPVVPGDIIGGRAAKPHSRPYMAFLRRWTCMGPVLCGGFLVRKDFVLTAAHCAKGKIMVCLGAHNINRIWGCEQQNIRVRHKILHPLYNRRTLNNDIMLLKLRDNATLTNWVRPINLPPADRIVPVRTLCSAAGWGRTSQTHTTITLREVNLTVMSDQTCKSRYRYYNTSSMLCAGDPDDTKTVYRGDSGGPLVCGGVAEGVISQSNSGAVPPAVYTWISHFMPWITRIMTHF
ncbi:cathepsin G-like [Emydura macquarii macquarii]|uniref:cathepsin G-like n=1 Tax=Emydura macquarii macquarii TaxID=1129001 RepID=UPI00352AFA84